MKEKVMVTTMIVALVTMMMIVALVTMRMFVLIVVIEEMVKTNMMMMECENLKQLEQYVLNLSLMGHNLRKAKGTFDSLTIPVYIDFGFY